MMKKRQQTLARPTVDIGAGAGAPPLERLKGIKFDLLRDQELLAYSVEQITTRVQLTDAKLGLPAVGENCLTCRATEFSECPGHFGHIRLAEPVFHPSYIHDLKKVLDRICIVCGDLKSKRRGPSAQVQTFLDALEAIPVFSGVEVKAETVIVGDDTLPCPTTVVRRPAATAESGPSSTGGNAVVSSGRGKRKFDTALAAAGENPASQNLRNYYFRPRKNRASKAEFVDLTADDEEGEAVGNVDAEPAGSMHVEPERPPSPVTVLPITTVQPRKYKSTVSSSRRKKVSKLPVLQKKSRGRRCRYCQPSLEMNADPYPKILLKVVTKLAGHTKDKIEVIQMEIDLKSDLEVPLDFWDFLGESACEEDEDDDELEFATTRVLLASSALRILEKVSSDTRRAIGCMDPEAMILCHLPVPPNCTRVVDDTFGATAADYGDDKTTTLLKLILQRNNGFTLKKITATKQFELLQGAIDQYFRYKGAGKVTGALEPRLGQTRLSEESLKTKWKNRLKDCVVGKLSNHCARSILTGDPLLSIEEIGIPDRIAHMVTVPVRVTNMNLQHFRKAVEEVANEGPRGSITSRGITYYERDEELVSLGARNATWEPQIGDIAYRCLRDGDLVFANRNPSLHKHSLIALKVRRHQPMTVSLNPLLCSPFNADFDGDALHVFAPQSFEALGEMKELMTVPSQMICPQGGQAMIRLSQDALLGAYLLTSTGVFMDKRTVDQLAAQVAEESSLSIGKNSWFKGEPAIVKSLKGGPFWTGAQVFGLSLPAELDYRHSSGVLISRGELLCCGQNSDWLGSTPEGVVRQICDNLGPEESVAHLNLAQSIIHQWLLQRGFSLGIDDVFASRDQLHREELTRRVKEEVRLAKLRVLHHPLVSGKLQLGSSDIEYVDLDGDGELLAKMEQTIAKTKVKHQEEIGIVEFRALPADLVKVIRSHMAPDNSLLRMVTSGSKGSFPKIVQQSGLVGLQLNVGAKLFPPRKSSKSRYCLRFPILPEDEAWAGAGFIGTSYLEGLNPSEFFCHAVSSRLATISQCLEVKEPGSMFKSLMCFLRDVYVAYDGTVRNRFGQRIIQLFHEGALSTCEAGAMDEKAMREICRASAGEPVGVLAVTALVQPIYQAILDTPHQSGVRDMRPLELLQETLLPRFRSAPKASDRRVILRLLKPAVCRCNVDMYGCTCIEKVAVKVQNHLRKVLLGDVAKCTAIHHDMRDDGIIAPWIGHIQLSRDHLLSHDLTVEEVIFQLQRHVKDEKNSKVFGSVVFSYCSNCNITGSMQDSCIHFEIEYSSRCDELESLESIRDTLLPSLLKGAVKGSSLISSVNIFWESTSSPTRISTDGQEEVVVEVETIGKQARGKSFATVQLVCVPIMDLIDWSRSAPYGVQELRQTHGIEAAHFCILHRLKLAVKGMGTPVHLHHLQLIADFMVYSGDAIGFVYAGYKEYIRSISATAPFSQGAFQAPWKSFTHAASKGHCEEVTSVLASCAWGKKAPIGTGADCDIMHQAKGVVGLLKDDIHELYVPIAAQVAEQTAIPDLPFCGDNLASRADGAPGEWADSSKPFSDGGDAWGANVSCGGASGGWGGEPDANAGAETGWGADKPCTEERPGKSPGWGGQDKTTDSAWGEGNVSGWGAEGASTDRQPASSPGWGGQDLGGKDKEDVWGKEDVSVKETATFAGWEDVGGKKSDCGGGWGDETTAGPSSWGTEEAANVGWNTPPTAATPVSGAGREGADAGWDNAETRSPKAWGALSGAASAATGGPDRMKRGQVPGEGRKKWDTSCSGANLVPLGPPRGRVNVQNVEAHKSGLSEATWGNDTNGWDTPNQNVEANKGGQAEATWGNDTNGWDTPSQTAEAQTAEATWGNEGAHGWDTTKPAAPADDAWGQVQSTAALPKPRTFDPDCAAGHIKNFEGERKKKWDTSCSGANLVPLGKTRRFWQKTDGDSQALDKALGSGTDTAGWGEQDATKEGNGGWGPDTGGWGGDQPVEKKASAKEDEEGWAPDMAGWGGERNVASQKDQGGWGGDYPAGKKASAEDDGGWGADQPATGGWGGDQPATGNPSTSWQNDKRQDRPQEKASWEKRSGQEASARNGQKNKVFGGGLARQPDAGGGQDVTTVNLSQEDQNVKSEIEILLQRAKGLVSGSSSKLSDEDGKFVVENILPYHPDKAMKVSTGIDHVKIDCHPQYPKSRCMFLVRADGSSTDLSYHRCLQELARTKSKAVFDNYSVLFKAPRPSRPIRGGE